MSDLLPALTSVIRQEVDSFLPSLPSLSSVLPQGLSDVLDSFTQFQSGDDILHGERSSIPVSWQRAISFIQGSQPEEPQQQETAQAALPFGAALGIAVGVHALVGGLAYLLACP